MGIQLVNFTPGTSSNQDWTYPELGQSYISSEQILKNILEQAKEPSELNGYHILIHFGTDPRRKDKLYVHLDKMIRNLKDMGNEFNRIDHFIY